MMGFLKTLLGFGSTDGAAPGEETSLRALPEAPLRSPSPAPPPPRAVAVPSRPLLTDGRPDFPSVLERAGVTADQQRSVEKAQELLKLLPSGATDVLKREIVEAAFSAFDISTQDIVGAASAHIEALNAYVSDGHRTRQQLLDEGDARVRELQNQIAQVRAETERAVVAEEARELAVREEVARVEPVLAFFLHEPVVEPPVVFDRPIRGRARSEGRRRLPEAVPTVPDPAAEDPMLVDVEVFLEEEEEEPIENEMDAEELELELDLDPDPDTAPDTERLPPPPASSEMDPELESALLAAELELRIQADEEAVRPLVEDDEGGRLPGPAAGSGGQPG